MLQNNIDKIDTHKDKRLKNPDEKLEELKAKMLLSETPDTTEKFGEILGSPGHGGWADFTPFNKEKYLKNERDFYKNSDAWKYILGLFAFLLLFLFAISLLFHK